MSSGGEPGGNVRLVPRLYAMRRVAVAVLQLGVLMGVVAPPLSGAETIAVGQPFPDLPLVDLDGAEKRVSDFRGSKLILHVFASW